MITIPDILIRSRINSASGSLISKLERSNSYADHLTRILAAKP